MPAGIFFVVTEFNHRVTSSVRLGGFADAMEKNRVMYRGARHLCVSPVTERNEGVTDSTVAKRR